MQTYWFSPATLLVFSTPKFFQKIKKAQRKGIRQVKESTMQAPSPFPEAPCKPLWQG
jgi:hypothetical protein